MSENETEVINIIRSSNDPEKALSIAINLLVDFLASPEAPQCTSSETLREVS